MAHDVDQIAADHDTSLKSWEKPELARVEFGEAEGGLDPGAADGGTLS